MASKANSKVEFQEIQGRPQVVLVGNGLDRLVYDRDWNNLIEDDFKQFKLIGEDYLRNLPMPVKFEAYTAKVNLIQEVQDELRTVIQGLDSNLKVKYAKEGAGILLNRILELDTDAILTTNFTKSIEYANNCGSLKVPWKKSTRKRAKGSKEALKRNLYSFKEVPVGDATRRLYYIHGIIDSINSIVFSQQNYDTQLYEVMEAYNFFASSRFDETVRKEILGTKKQPKKYIQQRNFKGYITNWVDLFRVADIYILGFGLPYAETDIWALLRLWKNLPQNEMKGHIVYYEAELTKNGAKTNDEYVSNVAKRHLLMNCGVEVYPCMMIKDDVSFDYHTFYLQAIKDIQDRMLRSRKSGIRNRNKDFVCNFVVDNN